MAFARALLGGFLVVIRAAGSLRAEGPWEFGFEADVYWLKRDSADDPELALNLYPSVALTHPVGDWTAEISVAPELYIIGTGTDDIDLDNPYLFFSGTLTSPGGLAFGFERETTFDRETDGFIDQTAFAFVEHPGFGWLAAGDIDSALAWDCIEAPGETTNVGVEDLTGFGSCEGFGYPDTALYITPDIGG